MFNTRDFIGLPIDKAKELLSKQGYNILRVQNNDDDRLKFDTEMVVKVLIDGNDVTLVTSKFLMNI